MICCFDDMDGLVSRSAGKAGRFYGAVFPRKVAWMRVAIAALNVLQRARDIIAKARAMLQVTPRKLP